MAIGLAGGGLNAQEKPRVAVLAFENKTSWWQEALGSAAADHLTTQLVNAGKFSVIEREMIDRIIEEQGFQTSGMIDPDDVVEIGRLAGVDYMLMGSVTRFTVDTKSAGIGGFGASITTAESALDVRAINTRTAEIVAAAQGEGSKRMGGIRTPEGGFRSSSSFNADVAQEALAPAVEEVVRSLASSDAFEVSTEPLVPATPPAIVGKGAEGAVYIDQGENFGVAVGTRYAVMRVVDEIIDADGNVLDQITDQVGVLEVTRVLSQSSICRVVEGEAEEGDVLRPVGGGSAAVPSGDLP
jgi:curli biogenesis system outer membrane secretion channel CsgG